MKEEEKVQEQPESAVTVEQTTVTEQPAEKSARDLFNDAVREYAPDGKYDEDENEYFSKGNEMITALKEKGKKWDELSNKLLKRFQDDPEDAAAFLDFADGMPLVSAIVKNKGREALAEPAEGDEGWDDFNKTVEDRRKKQGNVRALIDEMKKYAEESDARLNKFAEQQGWSDEEKQAFLDYIYGDLEKLSKGNIDDDYIARAMKSYKHDDDVNAALEQGRADGRNEKIEAERKRMEGSGLPSSAGGANAEEEVGETKKGSATVDFLKKMHR